MANFKATTLSTLPSIIEPLTESAKYWQNELESAKVAKEFSAINCIDMNSTHDILVTSSTRIAVYEYYSMEVKRSFSAPNFVPLFGAHFRKTDSKLIVSGSGDGVVRVWDIKNSKPLRSLGLSDKNKLSKHSAAVRRTHFCGNSQVVSFSDDNNIKLWDITEERLVSTFGDKSAHNDYIRASHVMDNSSTVISGSYDHSVKLWDTRSPQKAVNELDHGSPVESITVRNLMAISSGGDTIKIFDIIGGKVLKTLVKTHHKTVTCVYNYGQYLLTTSIDGHLKVYDSNFNIAASLTYTPSQLLSCAFDDKVLAVGANDGLFSVRKFKGKSTNDENTKSIKNKSNRYFRNEYFNEVESTKRKSEALDATIVVKANKKNNFFLKKHDELLKKFNHSVALNRVLRAKPVDPELAVSFMQELIRRGVLKSTLAGRTDKDLKCVMEFLVKHIRDPRFNRILVDVALILTDVYMPSINRSSDIQSMFIKLNHVISSELNSMQQMLEIAGQISSLINSSIK